MVAVVAAVEGGDGLDEESAEGGGLAEVGVENRVDVEEGVYNTSGFVDDTRAFLSIPARHDLARRIDAGYLAKLVVGHRLDEDDAFQVAEDLAYSLARTTSVR